MSLSFLKSRAMGASGNGMVHYTKDLMQITIGEMEELVASNPDHPLSEDLRNIVAQWPGETERVMYLDREIVRAVLENKQVVEESSIDAHGREQRRYRLVENDEKEATNA